MAYGISYWIYPTITISLIDCFGQYPTVFISYFCAFAVILIVPLDISLTVNYRNPDSPYYLSHSFEYDSKLLVSLYSFFFFPSLVLGSFGLVYQENYNTDGNLDSVQIFSLNFSSPRTLFSHIKISERIFAADGGMGPVLHSSCDIFWNIIGEGNCSSPMGCN